jgi:hypothetical protein
MERVLADCLISRCCYSKVGDLEKGGILGKAFEL